MHLQKSTDERSLLKITGSSFAVIIIGTRRVGSLIHSRTLRCAWGSLPSISSRITHVLRGTSYFKKELKFTGAMHESRSVCTSWWERSFLDAFTSNGSYISDRAAASARVVLPIPGVPISRTAVDRLFSRRY